MGTQGEVRRGWVDGWYIGIESIEMHRIDIDIQRSPHASSLEGKSHHSTCRHKVKVGGLRPYEKSILIPNHVCSAISDPV